MPRTSPHHPFTIYQNGRPIASIYVPLGGPSSPLVNQVTVEPDHLPTVPVTSSSPVWKILLGLILFLLLATAIVTPLVVMSLTGVSKTTTSTTRTTTGASIVYSQSLTSGITPSSECTAWTSFQSLLSNRTYSSLTLSGSNDPTGITLTDATIATSIANSLRTNTSYGPVSSNGFSWSVGSCGSGFELSASGSTCNCNTGYTVRPCIGNRNWGGINSPNCGASTQTLIVTFQYFA